MIKTYTPAVRATLTLPALPGLLAGWRGRILHGCLDATLLDTDDDVGPLVVEGPPWPGGYRDAVLPAVLPVSLPLHRWEARARVACWLAEGVKCGACRGRGGGTDSVSGEYDACNGCNATGYLRAPTPCWHFLDGPGSLPAWQSASLLHASALRSAAGMGAIVAMRQLCPVEHFADNEPRSCWAIPRDGTRLFGSIAELCGHGYALLSGAGDEQTLRCEVPDATE